MTIQETLGDELKAALRAKDAATVSCIRQVKAKIQETTTAKGFSGEVDDALHVRVIGAYVASLRKAIDELAAAGERGDQLRVQYESEIAYLEKYLPRKLDEAATRAIVEATVAELGVTDPKKAGQVMGAVMKAHRDEVDAGLVRRLVDEKLG